MRNLEIINLNEYERVDPTTLLNQHGRYFTNGDNNEFFYKCESLFLSSPTNSAIIRKYTNLIMGEGLIDLDTGSSEEIERIFKKSDLKLFIQDYKIQGNAALRIRYNYNGDIARLEYVPTRCIAIGKEEDMLDEPSTYYYSFDWNNHKFKPAPIPAFKSSYGEGELKTEEIAYLKSPSPQPIYSLPDWFSALQYTEMEMELSNFFISHIKTGFSGATVINVNQGNSLEEGADEEIKRKIKSKLTGTSGDRVIISINDNTENQTTVENLSITDAYQQYDFVSSHTRDNIMMAHQVSDPGLFGLPQSTGFSSDSDMSIQARKDLYRDVINPIRDEVIEFLKEMLPGINLGFKDFEDFDAEEENDEVQPYELKKKESVDTKNIDEFIEKGEVIDLDKWRLVDMDDEAILIDNQEIDLADTGVARPNVSSRLDLPSKSNPIYKIRFRYTGSKSPEREFCRKMMAADKIYRIEDIEQMRLSNKTFSPRGTGQGGYSVKLWKGGVNCKHMWKREIYASNVRTKPGDVIDSSGRTRYVDPTNPNAEIISPSRVAKEVGVAPEVMDPKMWVAPNDMPNKGRLN